MGITPDTFVFDQNTQQWVAAATVPELQTIFGVAQPYAQPQPQPFQPAAQSSGLEEALDNSWPAQQVNKVTTPIDNGSFFRKPMQWFYIFLGIAAFAGGLYAVYKVCDEFIFNDYAPSEAVRGGIAMLIGCLVFAFFGLFFWLNRRKHLANTVEAKTEFAAVPVFAHLLQSFGDFLGLTLICIVAPCVLLTLVLLIDKVKYTWDSMLLSCGAAIITGFFIILFFHYIADMARVRFAIANNTKQTAANTAK